MFRHTWGSHRQTEIMRQVMRYASKPHSRVAFCPKKLLKQPQSPQNLQRYGLSRLVCGKNGPPPRAPWAGPIAREWAGSPGGSSRSPLHQAQTPFCTGAGACETVGRANGSRNPPTKISPGASASSRGDISISHAVAQLWRAAPGSGLHTSGKTYLSFERQSN